jgi:hypothetical protein
MPSQILISLICFGGVPAAKLAPLVIQADQGNASSDLAPYKKEPF